MNLWNLIALPFAYVLWCVLHEGSHLLAARWRAGEKLVSWRMKIWPHRLRGRFVFASAGWVTRKPLTEYDNGWIGFAPRITDMVALIPLIVAAGLHAPPWVLFLLGGAALDAAYGSIGTHPESDLHDACRGLGMRPWELRTLGFGIAVAELIVVVAGCVFR